MQGDGGSVAQAILLVVADPKGSPLDVAGAPLPELVSAGVPALGVPLNGLTGACVPHNFYCPTSSRCPANFVPPLPHGGPAVAAGGPGHCQKLDLAESLPLTQALLSLQQVLLWQNSQSQTFLLGARCQDQKFAVPRLPQG